ncbi:MULTISPECIES: hypothetical protein [Burkholderia]|uniref:hypothetical protein n=1 Tax=Burkholderia TaxID=32008 RepID=UPI001178A2AE|nr:MULTISPECIES: hypothetical protein [Burkholderia]
MAELAFKIGGASMAPDSASYRPPHWPPPPDWVVSEDAQGNPLSVWEDDYWDFSAWAGLTYKLDFVGGKHARSEPVTNPENQRLLKLLATWLIWGPRGPRAWTSLRGVFGKLRRLVALCDREGILACDLSRFPRLIKQIPTLIPSQNDRATIMGTLDRLLRSRDAIGFALLDDEGLRQLAKELSDSPDDDEVEQTAYIPPRIWTYQNLRLRECLDDFLQHSKQVEECFDFCVEAYANNFGSLEKALSKDAPWAPNPFSFSPDHKRGIRSGQVNYGPFQHTAEQFSILELLKKWAMSPTGKIEIKQFSLYLNLVQTAATMYIANFTLQRKEEVGVLRADCLIWDEVPVLGKIPIIRGETTKTDPDSDARWPTSPSVETAVRAASTVARMRMRCAMENPLTNCSEYDKNNPMLFHTGFEPWSTSSWDKAYSIGIPVESYSSSVRRFPRLFDTDVLRITEEDLEKARMFTPNLDKNGAFKIGNVWPLAYHQLRRTGAINMFASGILSDSSIQVIMKHLTLLQTRYYGQNYSRLRFNEEFEGVSVATRYEVLARQIQNLVEDRYTSPSGNERKQEIVVNLVGVKDFKTLIKAGRSGEISFRETRLGGCTKSGPCDYGGIESVARCTGGDGDKPCRDAIFDKTKRPSIERQLRDVEQRLIATHHEGPRKRALHAEAQGLRNFLDATLN